MAPTRRELMLALAGAAAASGPSPESRILNSGWLWEKQLQQQKKPLSSGFEEIFSTTAAGFSQMELTWLYLQPDVAETVAALTKRYGLRIPIFYYWTTLHEPERAK